MIQIGLDENTNDAYSFTTVIVEPNGEFSLDTVKPNNDLYLRDTTLLNGYKTVRRLKGTELFDMFAEEINTTENCVMLDGIISYNIDRSLDVDVVDQTIFSNDFNNLGNLTLTDNADDVTFTLNDGLRSGTFDLYPYIVRSSNIHTTISGSSNIKFAINFGFLGAYINISNIGNTFTFKLITNSNKIGVSENISYARTINMSIMDASDILAIGYSSYELIIEFDYANSNLNMQLQLFDESDALMSTVNHVFDITEILGQNTLHSWGEFYTSNLNDLDLIIRINTTAKLLYQNPIESINFDYDLKYVATYNKMYEQREQLQYSNLILNGSAKTKYNYKTSIQYHNSYSSINGEHLNIGMFDYYYSPILNMYSLRPYSPETISLKSIRSYVISDANLINNAHTDDLEKLTITLTETNFNVTIVNDTVKQKMISYSQAGEYGNHEKYMNNVGILKRLDDEARFELHKAYKKETSVQIRGLKLICSAFNVVNPKGVAIQSNPAELNKEIYTDINYEYQDLTSSNIDFDDSGLVFNAILPSISEKLKNAQTTQLLNTISILGLQVILSINNNEFPITVDLGPSGKILPTSKIIPISIRVVMHGGKF